MKVCRAPAVYLAIMTILAILHGSVARAEERPSPTILRGPLQLAPTPERTIFGLPPTRFVARVAVDATMGALIGLVTGETVVAAATGALVLTAIDIVQTMGEAFIVDDFYHRWPGTGGTSGWQTARRAKRQSPSLRLADDKIGSRAKLFIRP